MVVCLKIIIMEYTWGSDSEMPGLITFQYSSLLPCFSLPLQLLCERKKSSGLLRNASPPPRSEEPSPGSVITKAFHVFCFCWLFFFLNSILEETFGRFMLWNSATGEGPAVSGFIKCPQLYHRICHSQPLSLGSSASSGCFALLILTFHLVGRGADSLKSGLLRQLSFTTLSYLGKILSDPE